MNEILIWLKKHGLYIERPFPWLIIAVHLATVLCMIGLLFVVLSWVFR